MREGGGGRGAFPKVTGACRRPDGSQPARSMQQSALLDKYRALTTIYAPRKRKPRKNKTADNRKMLDSPPIKQTLSPFHPLPAIGQKQEQKQTKLILLDMNKKSPLNPRKLDVLKPLTPLRIHTYRRDPSPDDEDRPQTLIRENTYDVIKPIFLKSPKVKKRMPRLSQSNEYEQKTDCDSSSTEKESPKTRFRNAAKQVVKLSSLSEKGKLLCLRERESFPTCPKFSEVEDSEKCCKLASLTCSPDKQKLNKISEIFQCLDMKGRNRVKRDNYWF